MGALFYADDNLTFEVVGNTYNEMMGYAQDICRDFYEDKPYTIVNFAVTEDEELRTLSNPPIFRARVLARLSSLA